MIIQFRQLLRRWLEVTKRIIGNLVGVPNPKTNWNQTDENKSDVILNKPEHLVIDEHYVHTDNNFTNEDKEKLKTVTRNYNDFDNKPSINGVELSGNVKIAIPTKTSELENDSNFVSDKDYVHTDNNFTDEDKEKINSLGGETEDNSIIVLDSNSPDVDKIYSKTITESIDFILPTVTDGKFHQILILASIENTPAITYGTDYYFGGVVPTVNNGNCDIIFEFDGVKWTAGVISKGSGN